MKTVIDHPIEERYLSDSMKDQLGEIACSRPEYYTNGDLRLLREEDLKLPTRTVQNVNKGSFGHVAAVMGEKPGASIIAASAAFAFGAGLVTLVCPARPVCCPYELMDSTVPPAATDALALGMGLGMPASGVPAPGSPAAEALAWLNEHPDVSCVFDADILKYKGIEKLIQSRQKVVLTPHPKEFATLLSLCGLGEYTVAQIAEQRFDLVRAFCAKFPQAVLILKGANVLISQGVKVSVNTLGSPCLAKGGSGDVLAGLVAALLAQHYTLYDAAVSASLAHALASRRVECSYGMTPFELIDHVKELESLSR
ncbi:MAG: NAD(P)H-hydrate dehydratase [Spirochaetia bacterium]|nr:NAD(P)H-hydrate dehydratase [Spirochaetia bacterium]